eukprot:1428718-Amphidinium_carterae.2
MEDKGNRLEERKEFHIVQMANREVNQGELNTCVANQEISQVMSLTETPTMKYLLKPGTTMNALVRAIHK